MVKMRVVGETTYQGNIPSGSIVKILSTKEGVAEIDDGRTQDLISLEHLEEVIEEETVGICVACDSPISLEYMEHVKKRIKDSGMCYDCLFWSEVYAEIKYPEVRSEDTEDIWVTENFSVYYSNKVDDSAFKGHGGRKLHAHKLDGTLSEGQNVWSRGELPQIWRKGIIPNVSKITV